MNGRERPTRPFHWNLSAAASFQKAADVQPDAYRLQNMLASTLNNIAGTYAESGQFDQAVTLQRRAVSVWRKTTDANAAVTSLANPAAFGLNALAGKLLTTGCPGEALERWRGGRRCCGSWTIPISKARNRRIT